MPAAHKRRLIVLDPPITPANIPGLVFWLDADSITDADGTAVATWPDKSGQGFDATQGTGANRPVIKDNVAKGRRGVLFTAASSHYMLANGLATPLSGDDTPFTAVFVLLKASNAADHHALAIGSSAAANPRHFLGTNAAGSFRSARRDSAGTELDRSGGGSNLVPRTVAFIFNGSGILSYLDGIYSIDANHAVGDLGALDRCAIGALVNNASPTGTGFFDGHLLMVAVWRRTLGVAEVSRLNRRYINPRYGLTAA